MSIRTRKRKENYKAVRDKQPKKVANFVEINLNELNAKVEAMQQTAFLQGALGILLMVRDDQLPFEAIDRMIADLQNQIMIVGPKTGVDYEVPGYEPSPEEEILNAIDMFANEEVGEQGVVEDGMGEGGQSDA